MDRTKMMALAASVLAAGNLLLTGCHNSQSSQAQPSAPVVSGNKTPTALVNDPRMSPQARAAISASAGKTSPTP